MRYQDGLGPYSDTVADDLYADSTTSTNPVPSQVVGNPPTPNVKGYIPYRGSEQHGRRFEPDTEGPNRLNKYTAEQQAFETYTDPTITPRDIEPIRPLAVQMVDTPNLLYRRLARGTTYGIDATDLAWHQILQADSMRKRVIVRFRTTGGFYIASLSPEQTPSDIMAVEISGSSGVEVLDSTTTSPLFVRVLGGDGQLRVSVWTEYLQYDGERIMNQPYEQD